MKTLIITFCSFVVISFSAVSQNISWELLKHLKDNRKERVLVLVEEIQLSILNSIL